MILLSDKVEDKKFSEKKGESKISTVRLMLAAMLRHN